MVALVSFYIPSRFFQKGIGPRRRYLFGQCSTSVHFLWICRSCSRDGTPRTFHDQLGPKTK